jgi:5-methylcytosine-specific restriction endonuclease McrA
VGQQVLAAWRSFDEFLERKFPESRRKAYYLMAIHEQLPRIHKVELRQVVFRSHSESREVLERDGWRCQSCGRMESLQVHHLQWRSRLGDDVNENLITLWSDCHQSCHEAKRCGLNRGSGARPRKPQS